MLFKQRNGNTAKTEEGGWSQKVDLELTEHSVVSVSRKKQGAFRLGGVRSTQRNLGKQTSHCADMHLSLL